MEHDRLTDEELNDLFARLFPVGFSGKDVLDEVAPRGWAASPLLACFHPDIGQVWREAVRMHRNVERLTRKRGPHRPEPTLEDIRKEYKERPVEPEREIRELVGMCLWDVFSDNHAVVAADGRAVDTGSFRGTGGFIADRLNAELGHDDYDYMDFYMGTIWISERADLTPVYEMVFRRLRRAGCDWHYSFPRLGLVDMRPLRDAAKMDRGAAEWAGYSPSRSFAEAQHREEEDGQIEKLQRELDDVYRREVEAARKQPPPPTVQAYRAVFGHDPHGWPPRV
jgi:hypothetical protein